jgi:hypothetical protein
MENGLSSAGDAGNFVNVDFPTGRADFLSD